MLLLEQFENLTLHPKNAARLKELVLQLAVQGKLTENWRRQNPDVESAAELLKRIEAEKAQLVKEKKIKKEKPLEPVSEDEILYTLPDGWAWCKLQDLFTIITDGDHQAPPKATDGIPFLVIGNVRNGSVNFEGCRYVPATYYNSLDWIRKPKAGDILYTVVGSYGIPVPVESDEQFCVQRHIAILKSATETPNKYLRLILNSQLVFNQATEYSTGIAQKTVPLSGLRSIVVPLPPLTEQEAIVERVEELMQKIEELEKQTAQRIHLKQHLGTAALQQLTAATDEELEQNWLFLKQHFQTMFDEAVNVKKLRETILQLAVQGKLTSTWRTHNRSAEPASELLKRIQVEKAQLVKEKKIKKEKPLEPISVDEVPYTLPESWALCRLIEVCTKLTDGFHHTPKKVNEGFIYVSPKNIKNNRVEWESCDFIEEGDHSYLQKKVQTTKGDILIANRGTIGTPAIVDIDQEFSFQNLALIGFNQEYISSKYIFYFILSKRQSIIDFFSNGGIQPMLSNKMLSTLPLTLPPLAEQEAIVAKVDQLMQLCDGLEQQIQQSEQEVEEIMQAVVLEALQVQEEEAV